MTREEEDDVVRRRVAAHTIPDGSELAVLMIGANGCAVHVRPVDLLHALRVEQIVPPIGFTR